jgi:hypothetical protein
MRFRKRRVLLLGVIIAVAFLGTTYTALEAGGVLVVETERADLDQPRRTRVWYITDKDRVYLEAGHPDNPWVRDLKDARRLKIIGEGVSGEYAFVIKDTPADRTTIRQMMREKYGWRDWWISSVFDTAHSRMVELKRSAPAAQD